MCNKKKKEKNGKKRDFSSHFVFYFGRYPCFSLIPAFLLFRVLLRRIDGKKQTVANCLRVCYNNYNVFVRLVSFKTKKLESLTCRQDGWTGGSFLIGNKIKQYFSYIRPQAYTRGFFLRRKE